MIIIKENSLSNIDLYILIFRSKNGKHNRSPHQRILENTNLVKGREALDSGSEVTSGQQQFNCLRELDILFFIFSYIKLK